jgi:hypothetical protein
LIEFTKIQLFVIWKRCTSLTVTDTDCKWKDGKWYTKQMETENNQNPTKQTSSQN